MTVMPRVYLSQPVLSSTHKVSHYGVRTTRILVLRDWYITVLGLAVVFESDDLCLLTFDNEHHRLSLLHADAVHVPKT